MKVIATGLLALAALVYVTAAALEPRYPWLFYVAAAAEAAMVGAIADWFAVVALFHHPMNLRFIPHTAVIPRNKARIAHGISEFIQQNFLTAEAVVARIAELQPARTLSGWLLRPENSEALARYFVRFAAFILDVIDQDRVRSFLESAVRQKLERADVAGAAAQVLDILTENQRHHELLEGALTALDEVLAREETRRMIAAELGTNAPFLKMMSDLFHLSLDERAARKIVDVAVKKISEVRQDRDHELRRRFDAFLFDFVRKLKTDEAVRAKVHRLRDDALRNPALGRYVSELWTQFREWLASDLAAADSVVQRRIASSAASVAARLQADPAIQQWIDEQILRALPGVVEEHRAKIGRFVEDQINSWQETRLADELERHIGPDLQYIRINGTVVGAAAGLIISTLTQLAR